MNLSQVAAQISDSYVNSFDIRSVQHVENQQPATSIAGVGDFELFN